MSFMKKRMGVLSGIVSGAFLICTGIIGGITGIVTSVTESPETVNPVCSPWMVAARYCTHAVHNIRGAYAIGLAASISGGIVLSPLRLEPAPELDVLVNGLDSA
jgi:hypothetical protein